MAISKKWREKESARINAIDNWLTILKKCNWLHESIYYAIKGWLMHNVDILLNELDKIDKKK